eukprot:CAMPEP_0197649118 /NCGR_PEP_ID=MMETSP1338-20131121/28159_1 /TAXON_ID=43686 ORGANISM="Pelagodinium beii, Strain RCC1491" /NCGR_SAMPLE_ID=MMETSP1338 /ASSEMBLY_ACC=CAM_ASM_000754 /LENGTH=205 /DNA_ID=CAMNT_0043223233 /DNA_START=63 /DNA_END=677 /DNA_ORIENTATION=-
MASQQMQQYDYETNPMMGGPPQEQGFFEAHQEKLGDQEPCDIQFMMWSQVVLWIGFIIEAIADPEIHWMVFFGSVFQLGHTLWVGIDGNLWIHKLALITFPLGILCGVMEMVIQDSNWGSDILVEITCLIIAMKFLFVVTKDLHMSYEAIGEEIGASEKGAKVYWYYLISNCFYWAGLGIITLVEVIPRMPTTTTTTTTSTSPGW